MIDNPLKYFRHSQEFYRFVILKYIHKHESLKLPIDYTEIEIEEALSHIHLQSMIDSSLLEKNDTNSLKLTDLGRRKLREHFIDYQLDLLILENELGDYFQKKIECIVNNNVKNVALYGASDTARSLLGHLEKNGIKVECIIDDDDEKQGGSFQGLPIISQSELKNYSVKIILIASITFYKEIKANIVTSLGDKYQIYTLLES